MINHKTSWHYVGLATLATVAFSDPFTLAGFAHGTLYLPVVLVAMMTRSQRFIVAMTAAAIVLTLLGLWMSPLPPQDAFPFGYAVVNRLVSAAALAAAGVLAVLMARMFARLQDAFTALEQAQSELADKHQLLIVASQAGRLGGWSVDLAEDRVRWSDEVAHIHGKPVGYSPTLEQMLGFVTVEQRELFSQLLEDCRLHGKKFSTELQILRTDGWRAWLRIIGQPRGSLTGSVDVIEGAIQDITPHKEAERQRELLAKALDAAADPVMVTSPDTTIEWINAAFTSELGYTPREAIGRKPRELLKSGVHDADFYREMWNKLLAGKVWSGEMMNRRRDGGVYPEHVTITPVLDAEGTIRHFIAIQRDIRRQREIDSRLRETQRLESVRHLSSGISRNLDPLLERILGHATALSLALDGNEPLLARTSYIARAAEQADRIIESLQAFARRIPLQPAEVDVNRLLVENDGVICRTVGEGIQVQLLYGESLWAAWVDENQLWQAILNLLLNARDAMPDGGRLTLETANIQLDSERATRLVDISPGHYVRITVIDNGKGVAPDDLPRVFEPFFSTRGTAHASGFGLAMVHGFAQQSGGGVTLRSRPREGTRVDVYLPRYLDHI
jgi:PAS domain S-box-containing protein